LVALAIFFWFTAPARAQYDTASVLGAVTDASGGVVARASVVLRSLDTGVANETTTGDTGNYTFVNVHLGRYVLETSSKGFKTAVTEPFEVRVDAHQRVDVVLSIGDTTERVTVAGAASPLETESSERGHIVGSDAIVNLPLNGRNYADLALLVPGVRPSASLTSTSEYREATFNINGQRGALNNFMVDGLDNNAYVTSRTLLSSQVLQPAPDAVAEFRVQTGNYSAEYGRAGGGTINVSIRSGTNELHGSAWDFMRNTALNAIGFFKPANGKPTLVQNQFGAAAGGPLKKNRLFLFADYEGFRAVTRALSINTIADAKQRQGIFGVPIKNPYTGEVYDDGRIPASAMSPFGLKVLSDLPLPNLPGSVNNFEYLPRSPANDDKGDARMDGYWSDRLVSFLRYSHRLDQTYTPRALTGPDGAAPDLPRSDIWQAAAGTTWTINAKSLVDLHLGASNTDSGRKPADLGTPGMKEIYGITGLPEDRSLVGGLNAQSITGYAFMGRNGSSPIHSSPLVGDLKGTYSRTAGTHNLKTGYEYQRINTSIDDFSPKYGQDYYAGQFSRASGASNSVYNIADFLFGARSSYQLANVHEVHYRQRMHFAFLQDDWKATSKLTVNLGLRWEFATPQWDRDNQISNFDPSTNGLIYAKGGSLYDRSLVNPDWKDFAPRAGLAYSLSSRTAIRAAYGIGYSHFNRDGGSNLLAYNGPFVLKNTINQTPSEGICTPGAAPVTCFRPVDQGYPPGLVDPATFNPQQTMIIYLPKGTRTPYVQTWHFTVQHDFGRGFLIDAGYVGNRSVALWVYGDLNQARPNLPGQSLAVLARRPIPGYDVIQELLNAGFSTYNGLQVKVEKRYQNGLFLLNSFTWSKAIDNAPGSSEASNGDGEGINFNDPRSSKGISDYDQPFNNTTSLIWEIPFHYSGSGGAAGRLLRGTANGWRLALIDVMESGQPINLVYTPTSAMTVSSVPTYRPNLIGNPSLPSSQQTPARYFNSGVVQIPTDITHPFGNAGRNVARATPIYQMNLGLQKDFKLPIERGRLEFRAEAFNALNKTNFLPASGSVSSAAFGTITGTFPARQVQFAMKLIF